MALLHKILFCFCVVFLSLELTGSERLQLRGILELGEHARFSIHDLETENTFWLQSNSERYGLSVVEYDKETGILKLSTPSGRVDLSIRDSEDKPLGVTSDASLRAKQAARQAWVSGPVTNPRLGNVIRERRSRGTIIASSVIRTATWSSDSSESTHGSSAEQASERAEQKISPEIARVQDTGQTQFSHGNPRVLVGRKKTNDEF